MNKSVRTVVVFTGSRSEYGLLYPVIRQVILHPRLRCRLVVSGGHFDEELGGSISEIKEDGLVPDLLIPLETSRTLRGMALGVATVISRATSYLENARPQFVLVLGDRFETLGFVIAAFYLNILIVHLFGGDVSLGGHLDDSVRHAITKLSHLHFVSSAESAQRVEMLGEETWRIFNVGSPAIDTVLYGQFEAPETIASSLELKLDEPIIVFTQHPVTTEVDQAAQQIRPSLDALAELGYQTVITYPNGDAGSEAMIAEIEEYKHLPYFRVCRTLGRRRYLGLLNVASVVVGNSSSGLMETPIFKVACVDVGTRQSGRLRAENVISVGYDREEIKSAVHQALFDEEFRAKVQQCYNPYGVGDAGQKIAQILAEIPLTHRLLQKKITY